MEKLVNLIVEKTGLSRSQAKTVVTLVLDYLKRELPPPVGAQIDLFVKNEKTIAAAADLVGGLVKQAGKSSRKKG